MSIQVLNKRKVIDHRYSAYFKGVTVELYAPTNEAAKQKAVEFFKPKKKEMQLLIIDLIEY